MRLEYYPIEKLKKELLDIIGRHLDLAKHRVFFFGSRVAGKGTDRSDIDVGIEGDKPVPVSAWFAILDEIELLPTLYKIDLVDFAATTAQFREVARQHREFITVS
jgi:type I restriction enzyme S subunit